MLKSAGKLLAALMSFTCLATGPVLARQPEISVRVRIDMRDPIQQGWFDPATEKVGLRGGAAPLSWGATLVAADPDGDGVFDLTVKFPLRGGKGVFVSHKFKVDGTDNPNDGWENGPNRPLLLERGANPIRAFDAPGPGFPKTATGDIRRHEAFTSAHVPRRDLYVLLPPGYRTDSRKRYPVLYMHDGQNLFDSALGNGAEWRVDETTVALTRRRAVAPVIVVGIPSLPGERIAEYTPTEIEDRRSGTAGVRLGGRAASYGRFLVEEVKPFIDRTYRTKPGASDTALGGSSLGGLVTMYLGLEYPSVFGTLFVVSPSVWWDDEMIVKKVSALGMRTRHRIWLDMGSNESEEAIPQARRLRDALVRKGWTPGAGFEYHEIDGAGHDESAWADRFGRMLTFAFGPRK